MTKDKMLAIYDNKLLACHEAIKKVEHELSMLKVALEKGEISKKIYKYYVLKAENKKKEFQDKQDLYFERMALLKQKTWFN